MSYTQKWREMYRQCPEYCGGLDEACDEIDRLYQERASLAAEIEGKE